MNLEPMLEAPAIIQIHVLFALPALVVGPFALFRAKRDLIHKCLGYFWMVAMLGVAISGLFIPSDIALIGWLGPIHLFSFFTLWGVSEGLYYIKKGKVQKHREAMQSVWFGAMGLAGLFTLLPGRRMNIAIFGEPSDYGFVAIGIGLIVLFFLWRDRRKTIRMVA